MKRQPIASAAAFFVLRLVLAETHRSIGESVGNSKSSTDGICPAVQLY